MTTPSNHSTTAADRATAAASRAPHIPVLPDVRMHIHRPDQPAAVHLHRSEICTARKAAGFTRHVEFDISGTALEGQFRPGQAFGVIPPGTDAAGRPHKLRLYSVCSPTRGEDGRGRVIATTVKRTVDEHWENHRLFLGVASNFLCDAQPGDEIQMTGPNGKRFLLPANPGDHDYIFFATGTGIAPFRGMLLDLLEGGCKSRIILVMGSPYATDLMYHDLFLRMQAEHRSFTYLTAISRERQDDGHDRLYVQDRLRTDRDTFGPLLESSRTLIYICGVAGMEMGIFQELAAQLRDEELNQYLHVEPEALSDIRSWTRQMIHKQVKPTKRVFMEVYA